MNTSEITRVGVILLAAGASRRMGRPKLLLPWGDTSILGHLLRQWRELAPCQIAVVHALKDRAVSQELDRLKCPAADRIPNPTPEQGMFSSIQYAARWQGWRPNLTHWAIVLGDQPHLRLATLRVLLEFTSAHPDKISQSAYQGHPRHPVILPKLLFQQLHQASEQNLKQFLQTRQADIALCEMDDPGLEIDIDLPADYQRATRL